MSFPFRHCIHHGAQSRCNSLDEAEFAMPRTHWSLCVAKSPKPVVESHEKMKRLRPWYFGGESDIHLIQNEPMPIQLGVRLEPRAALHDAAISEDGRRRHVTGSVASQKCNKTGNFFRAGHAT